MSLAVNADTFAKDEHANESERSALHDEIFLSTELYVEGLAVVPRELAQFQIGTAVNEQRQLMFDMNRRHQTEVLLPTEFFLPHGSAVIFRWDAKEKGSILIVK